MNLKMMARCALFAALMAVCAWIMVPMPEIAFTMQTFAVFLTLGLLGGKWGTVSILVYLIMGLVGMPVFAGFRGGPGVLLGVTGGYIVGFLASGLVYWAVTAALGQGRLVRFLALTVGLLACYAFGSVWFYLVYLRGGSTIGIGAVLMTCVVPYLLPDAAKLLLAFGLTERLQKILKAKQYL